MPRKSLEPGERGQARINKAPGKGFRARCLYRDHEGNLREVERHGATVRQAEDALDAAIKIMQRDQGHSELTPESTVSELAEIYWSEVTKQDKSPNTLRLYRDMLDRFIIPRVGGLKLQKMTVGRVNNLLNEIYEEKGYSVYKSVKSVAGVMFGTALRHDAMDSNPIRDVAQIAAPTKTVKALTAEKVHELRMALREDPVAIRRDLPDLVDFMLATGTRIGEACAVTWETLQFDALIPHVEIKGTVVRVVGVGLIVKKPKTAGSYRTLALPPSCIEMLKTRRTIDCQPTDPVFAAVKGGLRDPSNTQADLRDAFEKAGFRGDDDKITSHIFRKSLATAMKRAGIDKSEVRDQLGHVNEKMTDLYIERTLTPIAANVAEGFFK